MGLVWTDVFGVLDDLMDLQKEQDKMGW